MHLFLHYIFQCYVLFSYLALIETIRFYISVFSVSRHIQTKKHNNYYKQCSHIYKNVVPPLQMCICGYFVRFCNDFMSL